jgi:hypothetical protein
MILFQRTSDANIQIKSISFTSEKPAFSIMDSIDLQHILG